MRKALAVGRKEMRQIVRDRRTLAILVLFPAFVLVLFGYALNFDIRNIALAADDRDATPESRELVSAFVNSGYFDFVAAVHSRTDIERLMDANEARAVLVIPEGFARRLRSGETADVQVLINGDNANTAATVLGYAATILRSVSSQYRLAPVVPPVGLEPRIWYNPELRSSLFLVPGLIAYIAMLTAMIATALSVVREKEAGTMEQVRMAPISTPQFIVGKTIPYLAISLVSAILILITSRVLFGLPMRGSWWVLLLTLTLFLVGALGTGLFVSTLANTQEVAFQIALLLAFLPTFILSGFIFPISNMPVAVQVVTYAVPARYFLVALRGIVLKGVGVEVIAAQIAALTVYALAVLALASMRLRRSWA
ncbi:MAG TPA: ABC transporter permease [Vicinamibacterales bacterium]|nr:ABC transporter permease [Vicinamibacterales bacterium]